MTAGSRRTRPRFSYLLILLLATAQVDDACDDSPFYRAILLH